MEFLVERLGLTLPVLAAPMAGGPGSPVLARAAADAGSMGFLAAGYKTPQAVAERYSRYGDLKSDLAALVIESLKPLRTRYDELMTDPAELRAVVGRGAVKASVVAGEVYRRAASAVGLI